MPTPTERHIRVVVIPAALDQPMYEQHIDIGAGDSGLRPLQALVGGFIERIVFDNAVDGIINEEGKLTGLQPNERATALWGPRLMAGDVICGTLVLTGTPDNRGEMTDCPPMVRLDGEHVWITPTKPTNGAIS